MMHREYKCMSRAGLHLHALPTLRAAVDRLDHPHQHDALLRPDRRGDAAGDALAEVAQERGVARGFRRLEGRFLRLALGGEAAVEDGAGAGVDVEGAGVAVEAATGAVLGGGLVEGPTGGELEG